MIKEKLKIKLPLLLAFLSLIFNPNKLLAGTLSVDNASAGIQVLNLDNQNRTVLLIKGFKNLKPLDITFKIADDGLPNPDRYHFSEVIENLTNKKFTDYHLELGFLDENGKFTRSGDNDLLDFGTTGNNQPDPPPSSNPFGQGTTTNDGNTLDYQPNGKTIDPQKIGEFFFKIDVPDTFNNGMTFTLRQQPTVKEPPRKKHDKKTPAGGDDGSEGERKNGWER